MTDEVSADSVILLDVMRGVLDRCGGQRWLVQPGSAWCAVVSPTHVPRRHGWKLHVSATPLSAPLVLARVAAILVRQGCSFKFATDITRVIELVGPYQDRGSSGKFVTAYPHDDEQLRVLAAELDAATADMVGPRILSDRQVRPASLVHYRYGEFTSDFTRDAVFTDEGIFESRMVGPDGSAVKDERHAWFSPPAWAVSPFPEPVAAGASLVLGERFKVSAALRHANQGGVYQATDLRDGADVVIKQARAHIGAKLDGSDLRDLLRHEARILEELASLSVFPAFVAIFEQQGDLFLAEEQVPGSTLDRWTVDRLERDELHTEDVIRIAGRLVRVVNLVHEAGFVLCDLKPGNVIVTPEGEIRLIDAEVVAEQGQQRAKGYTPEFAAPELLSGTAGPAAAADCFSLGVTLFYLASGGLFPHWVSGRAATPRSSAERRELLSRIATDHFPLVPLIELIVGLTETDVDGRWSLDRAERFLACPPPLPPVPAWPTGGLLPADGLDRLLGDGVLHLAREMSPHETYLWNSSLTGRQRHDPCDAWRGAAGVLATLTRAAGLLADARLETVVTRAADWIDERLFEVPRILPGLCFGRAGTAWALHDAGRALANDRWTSRAMTLAGQLPTQGPNADVAFGLSGAGLTRLHLWQATGDAALLHDAVKCAESLLAAAQRRGEDWLWPVHLPDNNNSLGYNHYSSYGFAHGVAGIGTFLLAAAQATNAANALDAAVGVGDTLLRGATVRDAMLVWPTTTGGAEFLRGGQQLQWCNGPAGIGIFLLRLWQVTGQQRFVDAALRCAPAAADDWASAAGACCGLAGSGHFLIDLAESLGDNRFRARVEQVAGIIHAQASTVDGLRITCRPENGHAYAEGTAGVLDFLLRLRFGGPHPWLPQIHPSPPSHDHTSDTGQRR